MSDISNAFWSETDSSNNSASPNGWAVGTMLPNQVEPTGQMMMGAIKRSWDRINGTVTSGGSANAQTLTYSVAPPSYVTGEVYTFKAGASNSGATTLNVNALGAKNVYKLGSSGPEAAVSGDIVSGNVYIAVYDGTEFQLLNPGIPVFSTLYSDGALKFAVNGSTAEVARFTAANGFLSWGGYASGSLSNGQGYVGVNDTSTGMRIEGKGSVNDVTIFNSANNAVLTVPTGTQSIYAPTIWAGVVYDAALGTNGGALYQGSATNGLTLRGRGSSYDLSLLDLGGSVVVGLVHSTDDLQFNFLNTTATAANAAFDGSNLLRKSTSLLSVKENVTDLASTGFDSIQPVSFTSTIEGDDPNQIMWGFIADWMGAINPSLARYEKDGSLYGVDERAILALTVAKLKELSAEFEAYKAAHP